MSELISKTEILQQVPCYQICGTVREVLGPVIKADLMPAAVGDTVRVKTNDHNYVEAEVVGFNSDFTLLSALETETQIKPNSLIMLNLATCSHMSKPSAVLGKILDARGRIVADLSNPERGLRAQSQNVAFSLNGATSAPPSYLNRQEINRAFSTGIRAIDSFMTIGYGQRLCVLAEPGVGKSTLMAAVAKHANTDVNVIALIGERGREVGDFIRDTLSSELIQRTVLVVATSDEPALMRARAAHLASALAGYFRSQGKDVLLEMDSLTRYLRALREIGLAAGEVPVRRGYPPSVFAKLPKLIEQAGTSDRGSVTALYTVLLSGELEEDPMIEELQGLTDGHIVLSRKIAESGQYPAIDILRSLSRIQSKIMPAEVMAIVRSLRTEYSRYERDKELLALGADADESLNQARRIAINIRNFLKQDISTGCDIYETWNFLRSIEKQVSI